MENSSREACGKEPLERRATALSGLPEFCSSLRLPIVAERKIMHSSACFCRPQRFAVDAVMTHHPTITFRCLASIGERQPSVSSQTRTTTFNPRKIRTCCGEEIRKSLQVRSELKQSLVELTSCSRQVPSARIPDETNFVSDNQMGNLARLPLVTDCPPLCYRSPRSEVSRSPTTLSEKARNHSMPVPGSGGYISEIMLSKTYGIIPLR